MSDLTEATLNELLDTALTKKLAVKPTHIEEGPAHWRLRLEAALKAKRVSPEIISRVMRLNPEASHGRPLRGVHYTQGSAVLMMWGWISKGDVIRKHGREGFERLPREVIHKRGKRVYVSREAVLDYLNV